MTDAKITALIEENATPQEAGVRQRRRHCQAQ